MVKSKSPAQIVGNVLTSVFLLAVFIVMAYPFLTIPSVTAQLQAGRYLCCRKGSILIRTLYF